MRVLIKRNLFARVRNFMLAGVVTVSGLAALLPAVAAPIAGAEACGPSTTYTISADHFSWSNPTSQNVWAGTETVGQVTVTTTGQGTTDRTREDVPTTTTVTVTEHSGKWSYSDQQGKHYVSASDVYDINGNSGKYDVVTDSWQWVNTQVAPTAPSTTWVASIASGYTLQDTQATYGTWLGSYTSDLGAATSVNNSDYTYAPFAVGTLTSASFCATKNQVVPTGTVTISPTGLTNQNVTATLSITNGVQSVITAGTGWTTSDGLTFQKTYTANENDSVTFANVADTSLTETLPVVVDNIDTTAPTVTNMTQTYHNGGGVTVALTFSEAIQNPGQGWYGSGTTWQKVYYSSKTYTLNFKDIAGNPGTYDFTVDATAPTVTNIDEAYQAKQGGRVDVTLTFSEPVTNLGQGWYANDGTGTVWNKVYYRTASETATFTDLVGNPGSYTFDVDATAPNLTVDNLTVGALDTSAVITGTTDDSAAVFVTVNGTQYPTVLDTTTGKWSVSLPAIPPVGTYVVTATSTDAVGNPGVATGSLAVTAAPTLTPPGSTNPSNPSDTSDGTPTDGQGANPDSTSADTTPAEDTSTPGVLGDQTTTPNVTDSTTTPKSDEGVKGASTTKHSDVWVWWVILAAAVIAAIWWIIAGLRNRSNQA